ncbi:hypothetical protein [Pseudoxanthomonas sangjuensis]|uniref:hypothetical protein n=1 Tax=Pseudoxanthomonas sangjuensis TaxID=1503750 RepID=UPI00139185DC|nr:hypothetical protein [Pseudoxanthomonas sangjuensis]
MDWHVQRNLVEAKVLGKTAKNNVRGLMTELVGGPEEGERINPLEATDRNLLTVKQIVAIK